MSDNFWIILCPVFALLAMQAVWQWSGLSDLAIFSILFGLVVTGHHMPGWLRAFGEPAVYRQHKARLWVSLFAIPALVILPTVFGLGAVALTVAAAFDLWHVAMQQHGFGRIYAAKAGDIARRSARLDLVCVLVWYGTVVAWSDSWMQGIARALRKAGLPVFDLFSEFGWRSTKILLLAASLVLAAAYLAKALRLRREGIATPNKHLLHAAAFAVLVWSYQSPSWYRAQSVQNLFHALQYFFMVWIYGHLSIRRDSTRPGKLYQALFRKRSGLFLFGGLVALYGLGALSLSASGYRLTGVDAERTAQVIGSIGLASLLLHFYVDSFIWKARSKEVRATLAIAEAKGTAAPDPGSPAPGMHVRGALHALAYFGVPTLAIALVGGSSREISRGAERNAIAHEARLFPRSALARYVNGREALAAGDPRTAREELSAALALAPSFEGPAALLAELDHREGNRNAEIEHARAAVRAAPKDAALHYALGNALALERQLDEAESHYRETLRLKPDFAGAEVALGVLEKWRDRLDLALSHFRRAYEMDPDLADAVRNLAGALATLGNTGEALAVLARYRERHPDDAVAASLERKI